MTQEKMVALSRTGFGNAVVNFYVNTFEQTLSRKTVTEADEKALEELKMMVKALEKSFTEKKRA